ncbi:MAG: hypothetical protein MUP82_08170 [Candidatus Marinimicrobia bacterium]|nr:hypothetical protein [Candidatus Neomarinimicrobiota bacterium]
MSSRSLAAARSRRAGENAPPVSGNRPGTSIGSHAAFAQPGQGFQTNMPQQQSNVRTGKAPQPQASQAYQQVRQSNQQAQASLPFSKLSISDAIGLITLRLGRIEQWVMETDHDQDQSGHQVQESGMSSNSKVIDISVLNNIVSRLDSLEKMEGKIGGGNEGVTGEQVTALTEEVSKLGQQVTKFGEEGNKQMLVIAKHSEQLFRFERDLVETKDILKTFMLRYDAFVQESSEKFLDFETALTEVEKGLLVTDEVDTAVTEETSSAIESADLKSFVNQELAINSE